jgi:hypothetical protein
MSFTEKTSDHSCRVKARLISRGHDNRDIQSLRIYVESNPRLTRQSMFLFYLSAVSYYMNDAITAWRKILPGLEDQANAHKIPRLKVERDAVLRQRERFIHEIYEYTKTSSSALWPSLPTIEQILRTEPFLSLQNRTSNAHLDRTSCTEEIGQLPTIVSRLRDDFTDQLERLLLADRIGLNCPSNIELDNRTVGSNLDLATSVFTCHGCRDPPRSGMCLIGRDGCLNHLSCYQMFKHGITPSHIGCRTASALVLLLDLDPQTTSSKEMDETHALFVCTICLIVKVRRIQGHKVFTWRECVRLPGLYCLGCGLNCPNNF